MNFVDGLLAWRHGVTSLTGVTTGGDETGFALADVIEPPFKVRESARTKASNVLANLARMARVDHKRSFMSRAPVHRFLLTAM